MVAPGVREILGRIGNDTLSMARTVTPFDMKFEQYLEHVGSRVPVMMRKGFAQSEEVRHWVEMLLGLSLTTAAQRHAMHQESAGHK